MEDIHFNKIELVRFINSPVPSNAYLIIDNTTGKCVVIDPGSRDQKDICDFLDKRELELDYIILTHEHFDHCWGVNYILHRFNAKVIATRACSEWIKIPMNYFSKLYFDSDETYSIEKVDIIVEDIDMRLDWGAYRFNFIEAKGHTDKSICISFENLLFSGDTMIYLTKPWLHKRFGASLNDYKASIKQIYANFKANTLVYPGHGNPFKLEDMKEFYTDYFKQNIIIG